MSAINNLILLLLISYLLIFRHHIVHANRSKYYEYLFYLRMALKLIDLLILTSLM